MRRTFPLPRALAVLPALLFLVACGVTIDKAVTAYQITDIELSFAPAAPVHWPAKAEEYARQHTGLPGPRINEGGTNESGEYQRTGVAADDAFMAAVYSPEADAYQAEAFRAHAAPRLLAAASPLLPGEKPATLRVTMLALEVANPGARAVFGGDSVIRARLDVVDSQTGAVIASTQLSIVEAGMKGGSLIGLAINIVDAAANNQFDQLYAKFERALTDWMTSYKQG